jgi:predicted nucleotidyltransferase
MNAEPLLAKVAKAFALHRFEAVMVGNAAAALHGAPVTTLDIDFMFRKTGTNLKKLKSVAHGLDAVILKPYYPVSDLYRVINDDQGLQLDFMTRLHGIRSLEGLRSHAGRIQFGQYELIIASLADIIASKRAAGRSRDLAVLEILERTLDEQNKIENKTRSRGGSKKTE